MKWRKRLAHRIRAVEVGRRLVIATLTAWAAIVLAGWLVASLTIPPPTQYVAVRDLRLNHRLVEGDVAEVGPYNRFFIPGKSTRDDFAGRYVGTAVSHDKLLPLDSTLAGPRLPGARGSTIAWVPLHELPPAQIAALDVQDVLEICNLDGTGACGEFAVAAIVCSASELSSCSAGIHLSAAQRRNFVVALGGGEKTEIHVLTARFGGSQCPHGSRCN